MDSKYNSVGIAQNGKQFAFSLKRPFPSMKIKIKHSKKPKLDHQTKIVKLTSSTVNTASNARQLISPKLNLAVKHVNLLEERRKLPVYAVRSRLIDELRKNDTIIIISETGSGKTTQIPQIIHEVRMEGSGVIGVTQPRRIAAITISMRVAEEMNTSIGDIVGYTVRFEDVTSPRTKLIYLTDGMLLREAIGDPLLSKYSILVLDEAHERTVSTDILFGIVKIAQNERREKNMTALKVIIMSATMDVDSFSSYFNNCRVLYLEGRTHPVTIYHMRKKLDDYLHSALCCIFQLHSSEPSDYDFLVFLTGQEEIETLSYNIKQIAKEREGLQIKVCPMYAGLPHNKQLEAWNPTPAGVRKVVLATNIAETSVTIPNIKCVIDTGVVKERTWCAATGAERLLVTACARAACWQRAGRAGRDAPGAAYRLYTAVDMSTRPMQQTPEILRCPLASTVLWMIAIGIGPKTFPLLSPPPESSIQASLALLQQLGAVDSLSPAKLTVLGKKMSAFPIDPKYSKIILSANEYECLDEALIIVAMLSSENIFHSPIHKREQALQAKQKFVSPLGDHITLLNVFNAYTKAPLKKQWCKENYLHARNLAYASEVRAQLAALCSRFHLSPSSCGQNTEQVVKCLVSGMFSTCAWLPGGAARYTTACGMAAALHPASVLHAVRPPPPAIIYTDMLTTRRTYLAQVSVVRTAWIHRVAPDFARRHRVPHS